jgi:hypothetical protein
VLLYRAGIEFEQPVPEALTKMIAKITGATAEKRREEQAAKAPAKETGGTRAGGDAHPRAPRSGGRVRIRISSEHVRRVLKRQKDKNKD